MSAPSPRRRLSRGASTRQKPGAWRKFPLQQDPQQETHSLPTVSSAIGLLRWFWSALCGHKKASISFRPHRVDKRHGHFVRAQPLTLWQRNFSGQINSTAMRSVAMIHQANPRHSQRRPYYSASEKPSIQASGCSSSGKSGSITTATRHGGTRIAARVLRLSFDGRE